MRAAIGPVVAFQKHSPDLPGQNTVSPSISKASGIYKSALLLRDAQKRDYILQACIMHLLALSSCRIGRAGEDAHEDRGTKSGKIEFMSAIDVQTASYLLQERSRQPQTVHGHRYEGICRFAHRGDRWSGSLPNLA